MRSGRPHISTNPVTLGPEKNGEDGFRDAREQSLAEAVLGESTTDPYVENHREAPGHYRPQ